MKKYSYNATKILYNVYLLYFIFIIALINLIYLVNQKDITSFFVFIVSGLIVSRFSKNMIVIMFLAIVAVNIFKHGICYYRGGGGGGGIEGFEEGYDGIEIDTNNISHYIQNVSQVVGTDVTNSIDVKARFDELQKQKETIQNRLNSIS